MLTRRHLFFAAPAFAAKATLRISTFEADVTPPIGAPLCYSLVVPAAQVSSPLLARGIVLYPSGQQPIVLCAVDWLGIGSASHDAWRKSLALAAGTNPQRVAVQTVHQHDAPGDDRAAAALLPTGRKALLPPVDFCIAAQQRVAAAIGVAKPERVTHGASGSAIVERIASNRRILSPDGKTFAFQRFTACKQSPQCDAPEGLIDPRLKTYSFYNGDKRLASLHYYAVHPMSYYGKGVVNSDFVGIARAALPGFHVYFTGAAGNIGAGKYNDGAAVNRDRLAGRLADAMRASLSTEHRHDNLRFEWRQVLTNLRHREGKDFTEASIRAVLEDPKALDKDVASAARYLAWWQRCQPSAPNTVLQALLMDGAGIVHLPGESFVEFQLGAQAERPKDQIATAAYGDYGPMYIGTKAAYAEGGYETSAVSRVAESSQETLQAATRTLLR